MPDPAPPLLAYQPELDGLRALAVLAVVAFHARVPLLGGGFVGVDVFFVLSGYLITRLLLLEHQGRGRIDLKAFWVRRLRRLYPALLAMLAVFVATWPWLFPQATGRQVTTDVVLGGLYVSDLAPLMGLDIGVLNHLWTLAVEERFYLLWPLLLWALLARAPRRLAWVLGALFVLGTAWRWLEMDRLDAFWSVYPRMDTHCTGLVLGCWLAVVRRQAPAWCGWLGLALLAWTAASLGFRDWEAARWGFTLVEVATVMVLMAPPAWLGWAPLVWVGKLSYGWYLWHYVPIYWLRGQGTDWLMMLVVGGGVSLALATISYFTVEAHFRRRREAVRPLAATGA